MIFHAKIQIFNFACKRKGELVNCAPTPLDSNDWTFGALSCAPLRPLEHLHSRHPSMRIPVTLAGEKLLDEGYESCWLLQPPTVDALLNGYFFSHFYY